MRNQLYLVWALIAFQNLVAQENLKIFFQSDSYTLTSTEQNRLQHWIQNNTQSKILSISGYCDEDGSSAYNDTLSQKRVETVYQILKDKIAIRTDFKTQSFGKNHEQSKIKSENRRVDIIFLQQKDLIKEKELIPEKIIPPTDTLSVPIPDDAPLSEKFQRTAVGKTLRIKNINFHLNTFAIVAESRNILYELLDIMYQNPKLRIEIQGHICCNPDPKDKISQKLSTERAKAIKLFLVSKGIDAQRVHYKGFGSSTPLFPIPEQNETQRAENRRVEVLILEK